MSDGVLEVAQKYLKRVTNGGGNEIMATCPFHQSDNPRGYSVTLSMNLSTGLFICHSCKTKGNLRQFLHMMGVPRASVDKQYGVVLEELSSKASERLLQKQDPRKPKMPTDDPLPESILGLFDKCPIDLLNEGFEEDTLRKFDVGFDDKHMRITYPLRDLAGRLVGISGRSVTGAPSKYKVYSTEWQAFGLPPRTINKSALIWNYDRVYPEVYFSLNEPVVLVEGFKGVMWLHQAGIKTALALLTSNLSDAQQWLLEHLGGVVYIMLDNDAAGTKGTQQVAERLSQSLQVKIATYNKEAAQPTDLSPEEVVKAVDNAQDYFYWAHKRRTENGFR